MNPCGNHYSYYYTLHRIRLRNHWPHMAKEILSWITVCTHCLLKTGTSKLSTELLYTFPLHAPMVTVHIDTWVPGKTMSLDDNTSIMVIMCHMTGFVALEPFKKASSKSFAAVVYHIHLCHGLLHCIVTDVDSKFEIQW